MTYDILAFKCSREITDYLNSNLTDLNQDQLFSFLLKTTKHYLKTSRIDGMQSCIEFLTIQKDVESD